MDSLYLLLFIGLFLILGGQKTTNSHGGIHVKPKPKSPKPKVGPAPQPLRK